MEENTKNRCIEVFKKTSKYLKSTYFKFLVTNIRIKLYAKGFEKDESFKLRCHCRSQKILR